MLQITLATTTADDTECCQAIADAIRTTIEEVQNGDMVNETTYEDRAAEAYAKIAAILKIEI